jgi:serine/threonine-protein kinase
VDATLGTGTTTGDDPLVGVLLNDRYRLDAGIARGGMAAVYRGTDLTLDRTVAVKMMRPALAEDPDFVDRFVREARSAAKLSSADVVAVYDQGTDAVSGTAYLVMEHVEGRTLRDVVEDGPLPARDALDLLEPVLRALAAAHEAGLVHRDVKPENVLLGRDGRVKVADFGLARAVESSNLTATTGLLIGTVAYLAPEQVEHGRADARTDVYSAGILLFELLTGEPPYSADMALSVAFRHVHEDVPPPSRLVDGVPAAVDDLVQSATRRDPSARPVDAGAFLAQLRAVRAHLAPPDPAAAPVVRRTTHPTLVVPRQPDRPARPASGRRPWKVALWSLLVGLLVAACVAGGWYLLAGRYTTAPDVLGQTRAEALATLTEDDFAVSFAEQPEFSDQVPEGAVLEQSPEPAGRVVEGGRLTLVLSAGPEFRPVPAVAGLTREQAVAEIERAGLTAEVTEGFDPAAKGAVARIDPPAGGELRKGEPVQVLVSKGPEMLPVPDVRGRSLEQAQEALQEAGFTSAPTEAFSEDVDKGAVAGQTPAEGTAARGSAVQLTVSKGPERIVVPDVDGLPKADAEARLEALGLKVAVQAIPGPGKVRGSNPAAGKAVRKGSTVTLFVF